MLRRTIAVALLAGTLGLTACQRSGVDPLPAGSDRAASPRADSEPAESEGPSDTPSKAPAGKTVTSIPASAVLQPSDMAGQPGSPLDPGTYSYVRPLRPCGGLYPSDRSRTASVALSFEYDKGQHTVVFEYLARHRTGTGPAAYAEIIAALERCQGTLTNDTREWTVQGSADVGDESERVRIDSRITPGSSGATIIQTQWAVVARVGDAILVITDMGWESGSGTERAAWDVAKVAAGRAAAVR